MRVDIMMPTADAERTEMKEQKKSKSLEIVEKQRALVVEKIIEDMKRDGLYWSEPYIPPSAPTTRYQARCIRAATVSTSVSWATCEGSRTTAGAHSTRFAIAAGTSRRGPRPRSSRNGASSPSRRRTRTRVRRRSPATTCAAWAIGTSSTPARLRASPPHRYRSM